MATNVNIASNSLLLGGTFLPLGRTESSSGIMSSVTRDSSSVVKSSNAEPYLERYDFDQLISFLCVCYIPYTFIGNEGDAK